MRTWLFGFLLAVLVALATPAAATVKEAEAAIAAGRHSDALATLAPLVAKGDRDAQTLTAGLLLSGLGATKDVARARELFTAAAQQGQPFAQYNLAVMYHHGDAGAVDLATARHWYALAAQAGMVPAMTQWALFQLEGHGGARDPANARRWAERAANAGDPQAQYLTGILAANGEGKPADTVEAYVWLLLADRSGFKPAQESLEILKHRLSAEERTKAEQAAIAWRPTAEGTDRR